MATLIRRWRDGSRNQRSLSASKLLLFQVQERARPVGRACNPYTDSQEAQKIRMSVLREVEDGLLPNSRAKWTLEQAVTQWLSDRKLRVSTGAEVSGMNNGQVNKSELQHIVISELKIRPPVT